MLTAGNSNHQTTSSGYNALPGDSAATRRDVVSGRPFQWTRDSLRAANWDEIDISNPDTWIPKQEAIKLLGIGERTVERLQSEGRLEKRLRQMAGSRLKGIVIYNPRDVQQILLGQLEPQSIVQPAHHQPLGQRIQRENDNDQRSQAMAVVPELVEKVLTAAVQILEKQKEKKEPEPPPLWMTLDQAVELSGLSQSLHKQLKKMLVSKIEKGELSAWKVAARTYVVHRDHVFNFQPTVLKPEERERNNESADTADM